MPADSPYSPPQDIGSLSSQAVTADELERKKKFWKITAWVSGGLVMFLIGLVTFIIYKSKILLSQIDEMEKGVGGRIPEADRIRDATEKMQFIILGNGAVLVLSFLAFFIIGFIRFRSYRAKILNLAVN
jgi:hypothetical protein